MGTMVVVKTFAEAKARLGLGGPATLVNKKAAARAAKKRKGLVTAACGRLEAEGASINALNVRAKMKSIAEGRYPATVKVAPERVARCEAESRQLKELSTTGIQLLRKGLLRPAKCWSEWLAKCTRSKRVTALLAAREALRTEALETREAKRAAWVRKFEQKAFAGSFARKARARAAMLLNKALRSAA